MADLNTMLNKKTEEKKDASICYYPLNFPYRFVKKNGNKVGVNAEGKYIPTDKEEEELFAYQCEQGLLITEAQYKEQIESLNATQQELLEKE